MLNEKFVSFSFKGNRSYVAGTDIYDSMLMTVLETFSEYPTSISGSFHNLLNYNGVFSIHDNIKEIENKEFHAVFNVKLKDAVFFVTLLSTDKNISSNSEYNEDRILKVMHFKENVGQMIINDKYSYMEQIVAMTKKLHFNIFPKADGKWLFTKILITDIIDPKEFKDKKLTVSVDRNLHYKLTQNSIFLDNQKIGNIWFSLVR